MDQSEDILLLVVINQPNPDLLTLRKTYKNIIGLLKNKTFLHSPPKETNFVKDIYVTVHFITLKFL